ncbi:hypothetical protein HRG_014226 [Hirsutella rhossiliensis]
MKAQSEQVALCTNLAVLDGVARLTEAMQAVLQQLGTLNRKVDDLDVRMKNLDRKVTVANRNSVARAQNSTAMHGNGDLVPLYSVVTGERLNHFPPNVARLEGLDALSVDYFLWHLDEPVVGSVEDRRRNLRLTAGLITWVEQ